MTILKHGVGAAILSNRCSNPEDFAWTNQICAPNTNYPSILLVQRGWGAPSYAGDWGFPAGLTDGNEDPRATCARETSEEIGLPFFAESEPFWEGAQPDRTLEYYLGTWTATERGPELRLTKGVYENCGLAWWTLEQALNLPLSFRYHDVLIELKAMRDNGEL